MSDSKKYFEAIGNTHDQRLLLVELGWVFQKSKSRFVIIAYEDDYEIQAIQKLRGVRVSEIRSKK